MIGLSFIDKYVRRLRNGSGGICLVCCKKFSQISSAFRHFSLIHTKSSQEVSCSVCGKTIKNKVSLDQHMRTIHGVYKREILGPVHYPTTTSPTAAPASAAAHEEKR
eukprot:TRINITY_DN147_c0_g1_i1.p2 TRINITY_DN147_c0_g1~~TRINITY_DN147_c0_g1_i1.p2  ORF type:complete len:107 (+),score=13.19 TRINITY_DN147_c0_g1_i1:469-789(+)